MSNSEPVKETVALDFKYGDNKMDDKKVRLQSYELGGGKVLANMLQAAVNPQSIGRIGSVCIVLDLSKPGNCVESLLFWLSAVREHIDRALKDLQNTKIDQFRMIKDKMSNYWNQVPS